MVKICKTSTYELNKINTKTELYSKLMHKLESRATCLTYMDGIKFMDHVAYLAVPFVPLVVPPHKHMRITLGMSS